MQVAVVGAGLSGLTAAYYLRRQLPQAQVTILEASDHYGGVIHTEHRDNWLIEHGADCFSVNPPDALQLCEDLGLADQLIEPLEKGRRAMISRGSTLLNVPEGFVLMRPTKLWEVMKSPLLSWRGKIRLAAERFVKKRQSNEDESLASFVRRRLGKEVHDRLVQPLVAGIYTADAEKLSMDATMPQFVTMERQHGSLIGASSHSRGSTAETLEKESSGARYGQFRVFPEGMSRLFTSIIDTFPPDTIRYQTAIQSLTLKSQSTESHPRWELKTTSGRQLDFDGVLLALPGPVLHDLLLPLSTRAADLLAKVEYASSAIVLLGVPRSQIARLPEAFGFVCPAIDGRPILAASFASHKFPGRAPQDHVLIRVFIGGALAPEMLQHSDDELTKIASQEMRELIGMQGSPTWTAVQRWMRAMPQYHVGHRERAQQIESAVSELPHLEIAGNALHGVGIAPVVGTAKRAAHRLAKSLTTAAP
jgi:oxygen-dependent protoporphyrinogen oxidase